MGFGELTANHNWSVTKNRSGLLHRSSNTMRSLEESQSVLNPCNVLKPPRSVFYPSRREAKDSKGNKWKARRDRGSQRGAHSGYRINRDAGLDGCLHQLDPWV